MVTDQAIKLLESTPLTPVPLWQWREAKKTKTGEVVPKPPLSAPKAELVAYRELKGYEHRIPRAQDVIAEAELEVDEAVLACVLSSEFPMRFPAYLLAGAHAVINDATALFPGLDGRRAPDAILRRVCGGTRAPGFFGRQAGDGSARWCSSHQPPTARTLEAARMALRGVGRELAQGARRWIDPKVQDGGKQAGEALKNDALAIIRSRYKEGWQLVKPDPRIDQYVLALLAEDGGVSLQEAERVIRDGQKRWMRPRR